MIVGQVIAAGHEVEAAVIALVGSVLVAALTVGLPLWWSSRRGRQKLTKTLTAQIGQTDEGSSITDELQQIRGLVATSATAAATALAISEANGVELRILNRKLDKHLVVHGCVPLDDLPPSEDQHP